MPERSSLLQAIQLGVEATSGTSVAATKRLQSTTMEGAVNVDMQRFRPIGQKYPSTIVEGKEWSSASLTGVLSYTDIIYLLASNIVSTAGVQQAATTAYKWTFAPSSRATDTVKTYTLEFGGAERAQKFAYGLITDFGFTADRGGCAVTGNVIGQKTSDGITMTGSVPDLEEMTVIPNEIDIFLDTTSAGLGTTKLTRVLNFGFQVQNRFSPVWVLNSANPSFVSHVEVEPTAQATLMVEADTEGMAHLTALRAGSARYIRFKATSPNLAGTAIPYSLTFDMAVKVSDVSNFQDQDGIYAIEWTFDLFHDPSWGTGKAMNLEAINKQTIL